MSQIKFYYKPKKKYPARIYALWGNEWSPRNLMPMGISKQPILVRRPMTKYEQERNSASYRMIYYQFESLSELISYEKEELADDGKSASEIEAWISELTAIFSRYFPNS